MYAYRAASKPGSVLAPADFTTQLRRDTGNPDLHCWWDPTGSRLVERKDGTRDSEPGCWVVWQRLRVLRFIPFAKDVTIGVSLDKWVDVYKLDGEYGCPTVLGSWVAKALNESDVTKRGNSRRGQQLNDMNERAAMDQHVQARKFSEEFMGDKFVQRMFAKSAEQRGVPLRTKQDVDEEARAARKLQEEQWAQYEKDAKRYRVYGDVA